MTHSMNEGHQETGARFVRLIMVATLVTFAIAAGSSALAAEPVFDRPERKRRRWTG